MSDPFHISSILDGDALRHELTAIALDKDKDELTKRQDVLVLLKAAQDNSRHAARERLEDGEDGRIVAQLICQLQDIIIQVLYDYTTIHIYRSRNPTEAERLGVVAIGGYGRGDLAPGSDIDLLFLLPYKQTPWGESVVEYMLYLLWDLGLKVGHATRTVQQCISLSRTDMTIRTSLLETRHLCGDHDLFQELRTAYWEDLVPGTERAFIEAKLEEREQRHVRAGESRYLVEPNLKEGKGGMRDLHSLFWMAKYVYKLENPRDLMRVGLINDVEYKRVLKAYAFLWSVRCHLHFFTGRAEERLTFDLQPEIARLMGYENQEGQSAVEAFMKDYFRVAKSVGDWTRIFCAGLEARETKRARPSLGKILDIKNWKRKIEEGFTVESGRLNITEPGIILRDKLNLLKLFHIAAQKDLDIHPDALKLVSRSLRIIDDELRNDPEANRLFLDILTSPIDPERALRLMSEAGVLGRFIEAFGLVEAMMQFNMYHHYTVDEHTLRAIGILAQIEKGELGEEHPLANDIIHKVQSRDVLYVALFLHDIAKGRPEDHSLAGAEVARELCPRLGMDNADTDTVAWLVEKHLFMSEFAQSRDISDPKTIEDFVDVVQSPERLRLLLVLTVADIRAVGPGVWNGWKGQLLRDLYYEAESVLQGEGAAGSASQRDARVASARDALAAEIASWPAEDQDWVLSGNNDSYWLIFDTKDHVRYAELMREAAKSEKETTTHFIPDHFMSITEVAVYTKDQPGLFSQLTGAIALCGATIMDAKVFTMSNGMALDVFFVQDASGEPFADRRRLKRLATTIEKTVTGEIIPADKLSHPKMRRREQAFVLEPVVLIDNTASEIHSMIEVSGRDRPGLLYDLARTLVELRLSIASAHISTYGERAVDVFYVKDRGGFKITNDSAMKTIRESLKKAMRKGANGSSQAAAE